jgi:hypothetical protein
VQIVSAESVDGSGTFCNGSVSVAEVVVVVVVRSLSVGPDGWVNGEPGR